MAPDDSGGMSMSESFRQFGYDGLVKRGRPGSRNLVPAGVEDVDVALFLEARDIMEIVQPVRARLLRYDQRNSSKLTPAVSSSFCISRGARSRAARQTPGPSIRNREADRNPSRSTVRTVSVRLDPSRKERGLAMVATLDHP